MLNSRLLLLGVVAQYCQKTRSHMAPVVNTIVGYLGIKSLILENRLCSTMGYAEGPY